MRWGGSHRDEILAEGARARSTRVFAGGVMTGFTLAVD
jgi:hypothetical protein